MATNDELINDGLQRLGTLTTDMLGFVDDLRGFIEDFNLNLSVPGGRNFSFNLDGSSLISAIQSDPDRPTGLTIAQPPISSNIAQFLGQFDVRDVGETDIPVFNETSPLVDIPERPTLDIPDAPGEPSIGSPSIPASPDIELPTVPSLLGVQIPDAPGVDIPLFTEEFPEAPEILIPGPDSFDYSEEEFSHPLLTQVTDILLQDLESGAGINLAMLQDEEQQFDRLKDREYRAGLASEREIMDTFAQRGFPLPPGSVVELMDSAQHQARGRISEANRELTIKRVDLFRRAREFAVENGSSLVQSLHQQFAFKQQRLLDASKFFAQFSIELVDVQIRRYNMLVQAYQAFAQAYETRVRAVLAQIEIYRSQIEAERLKQEINESQIRIYTAQIDAARTLIDLFNAQMNAARLETEIEQLKIQIFESRTRAFVSQVDARRAEVDLYRTSILGEQAKVDVFRTQVGAFESQVNAARAQADIRIQNANSDIEKARLSLQAYNTDVDRFRAQLSGEVARVESLSRIYATDIDAYRAQVDGWAKLAELDISVVEAFLRASAAEQELDQNAVRASLQAALQQGQIRLAGIQTGTEAFAQTMQAAQEVMNVVVQSEEPAE